MDLLVTYTHDSELQAITVPPLISMIQITTAFTKPFPACCVFTSRSLARASNSGDSSASCAQVLSSQTTIQNSLGHSSCLQDNHVENTISNSTSVVQRFVAVGTCLPSHCLETSLVYSPILLSLHSNGCTH
jgi:hypothetical protein